MKSNFTYTAGIALLVGALLMVGTNVFASNSSFRSNLTNTERIALERQEDKSIAQHEITKSKFAEDYAATKTGNETCGVTSVRADLSPSQAIELMGREKRDYSYRELVSMVNDKKATTIGESCSAGSFRQGLTDAERATLEWQENRG